MFLISVFFCRSVGGLLSFENGKGRVNVNCESVSDSDARCTIYIYIEAIDDPRSHGLV
jgi:hypothetical protein